MIKVIRPSVLIVKDDRVLVLKSKYKSGEFYLLPGGGIEEFETLQETAVRETKEETNLDIKLGDLLYLQEWINPERKKNVLYAIFKGEIISGKETHLNDPCLDKGNITAIEWKTIQELEDSTFFPKEALSHIKRGMDNNFSEGFSYLNASIEK